MSDEYSSDLVPGATRVGRPPRPPVLPNAVWINEPTAEEAVLLKMDPEKLKSYKFKRGRGCSHCNGTGLLGRTGIYEMLEMTGDMVAALNQNQGNEFMALADQATQGQSLKHHALRLAREGRAPVSEVIRVASELGD